MCVRTYVRVHGWKGRGAFQNKLRNGCSFWVVRRWSGPGWHVSRAPHKNQLCCWKEAGQGLRTRAGQASGPPARAPSRLPPGSAAGARLAASGAAPGPATLPGPARPARQPAHLHLPSAPQPPPPAADAGSRARAPGQVCRGGRHGGPPAGGGAECGRGGASRKSTCPGALLSASPCSLCLNTLSDKKLTTCSGHWNLQS